MLGRLSACLALLLPSIAFGQAAPVMPSRALASSLDLSLYSVITTQGYASPGDGGGGIFVKVSVPFTDNYITGFSYVSRGVGCTNGTYQGADVVNVSGSGTGHGAKVIMVISGGSIVNSSVTTPGNQYAVGDVFAPDLTAISLTCSTYPSFTVSSVVSATCSFTDSVGNKWQLIVGTGNLNVKQCGAKADYYRPNGDAGSTDDTVAVQNALYFAGNCLPPSIDAYGQCGTILEIPRGISLVGALIVPQGVWFRGKGRYSSGLKMLNSFSNSLDWITMCDIYSQLACMGSQLTDMTLWHNGTPSAAVGASMVYTNNLQQATAFARLHVSAGSRVGFNLQYGWGGAALIGFQDIECGNSYATNPCMIINMPVTKVPMDNVIVESGPAVAQSGISITGGYVDIRSSHCENYATCVDINQAQGIVSVRGMTGNVGCGTLVRRQSTSTANSNIIGQSIGCTNTLNNGGATTAGKIVDDTKF